MLEISFETLNCFAVGKNNFCSIPFTTSVDVTKRISFEINPYRKKGLMAGLDEIGETLKYAEEINSFESQHKAENPWLFQEIKN